MLPVPNLRLNISWKAARFQGICQDVRLLNLDIQSLSGITFVSLVFTAHCNDGLNHQISSPRCAPDFAFLDFALRNQDRWKQKRSGNPRRIAKSTWWSRDVARWFRFGLSVAGPFVCRCLTSLALLRFHIPLIEPDVRICRIRLSEKTHAIAVAIACDAVCNF